MNGRLPLVLACVLVGGSTRAWAAPPEASADPLPAGAVLRVGTVQFHHPGAAHVEFSPDGKQLLTSAHDGIRLWNTATGKPIREIKLERLVFAGLTADGKTIVAWNANPIGKDRFKEGENPKVHVFDAETGKEARQFPLARAEERSLLAARPQIIAGKGLGTLATKVYGQPVIFYDVATGKETRRLDSESAKSLRPFDQSLRFSPDGKLFAGSSYSDVYYVFDVATGKELHRFPIAEPRGIAEPRDLVSSSRDGCPLLFSPDGKILTSGLHNGALYLWDLTTGKELCRIKQFSKDDFVRAASFSPDGKLLCTQSMAGLRLWEVPSGKLVHQFKLDCYQVLFSANTRILVATEYAAIHVIDLTTGKEMKKIPDMPRHYAGCALSPDGLALAAVASTDHRISVWRIPSVELDKHFGREHRSVEALALANGGKSLASWNSLGHWQWHDASTGQEVTRYSVPGDQIGIASDGKLMASRKGQWPADGPVILRAPNSGKETGRIKPGPVDLFTRQFALSPDSRRVAIASWRYDAKNLEVSLYEADQGKLLRRLERLPLKEGHYWHFWDLAFSPDGQTLAIIGSGSPSFSRGGGTPAEGVYLWDVAGGKKQPLFWGKPEAGSVAFSSDSRCLLIANDRQPVRLVEVTSGGERCKLERSADTTPPYVFSPDGKLLACARRGQGLRDSPILLWDLITGQPLRTLPGHQDRVLSLAFTPDGKRLISGSADTTLLIWDVRDVQKGKPVALAKPRLDACWKDLEADAAKANAAMRVLIQAPDQAVTLLEQRLRPEKRPDINQLVADLDSSEFPTREKASQELRKLGIAAEPTLRKALQGKPSAELRRRVEDILARLEAPPPPDVLQGRRAIEVLEKVATPKARELLHKLAMAAPGTPLGEDAQAALTRLKQRLP
jgi:WD40 repeat protein